MSDERWADAQRLEAWAGETRVNLVRAAALVAFYGYHVLNVYVLSPDDSALRGAFHQGVTAVVVVWAVAVLVLHVCLEQRYVPPALKYVATFWDLALITALLALGGEGPRGPLALLYFVVVAAAPLRLSLPLVWVATLGAMAAPVLLLGYHVYFRLGPDAYYALPPSERLSRTTQVLFLLSVGTVGLLGGQLVRQARRLAVGPAVRVVAAPGAE